MKIIDAHLHMNKHEKFDWLCRESGNENSFEWLTGCFDELEIKGCVVMGSTRLNNEPTEAGMFNLNGQADPANYTYPPNVAFCAGVDSKGLVPELRERTLYNLEKAARCASCVGFKIYLGYQPVYADDPLYHPVYELALKLGLTVVFHTGDTAVPTGRLRYSHPLTVDDAAVSFPDLRMVIAHFGNPWMLDAAEVAKKNDNVYIDLSGLAAGRVDVNGFTKKYCGYVEQLKTWLSYLDRWDKVMYGTDWPLVDPGTYMKLISSLVPEEERERVFYDNALSAFPGLKEILK